MGMAQFQRHQGLDFMRDPSDLYPEGVEEEPELPLFILHLFSLSSPPPKKKGMTKKEKREKKDPGRGGEERQTQIPKLVTSLEGGGH